MNDTFEPWKGSTTIPVVDESGQKVKISDELLDDGTEYQHEAGVRKQGSEYHPQGQTSKRSSSTAARKSPSARGRSLCYRRQWNHDKDASCEKIAELDSDDVNDSTNELQTPSNTKSSHDKHAKDYAVQKVDDAHPDSVDVIEQDFTNVPHPALETPLLYFLLRRFPCCLDAMYAFYNLRWDISSLLQNRIPCTKQLRKLNVVITVSELLILLPFFALVITGTIYSLVWPNVSISGQTSRSPLIFTFVTATKNNILTFFFGIPVERAIMYHKLAARISYLNGLLHTFVAFRYPEDMESKDNFFQFLFQDQVNSGGTMLILFMSGIIVTALPCVRRKFFEIFYYIHVVFSGVLMVCAFYHTGILVPILGSLTWGLDLVIRKLYMPFVRYPRKGSLEIISESVVELSFPKQDGFDFNPGQYIYVAVPKLSYFQWHPFSLSSSPKQNMVTLHIRKAGDWTNDLYELATKQAEVDILMEGPYGSVGVELENPYKYQTVILFSGGIGVTPMQSLCNSLMFEHNQGIRKLKKISFIWIERDPVIMSEVDVVRREGFRTSNVVDMEHGGDMYRGQPQWKIDRASNSRLGATTRLDDDGSTDFVKPLSYLVPSCRMTDTQLAKCYPKNILDETEHGVAIETAVAAEVDGGDAAVTTVGEERASRRRTFLVDQAFLDNAFQNTDVTKESIIDLQVYLTAKDVEPMNAEDESSPSFIRYGRPDIKRIFLSAREDALRNGSVVHIAVCVCAPQPIVNLCRQACAKYSDRYVAFDFHYECFE